LTTSESQICDAYHAADARMDVMTETTFSQSITRSYLLNQQDQPECSHCDC